MAQLSKREDDSNSLVLKWCTVIRSPETGGGGEVRAIIFGLIRPQWQHRLVGSFTCLNCTARLCCMF
jgi:hypothetical protein